MLPHYLACYHGDEADSTGGGVGGWSEEAEEEEEMFLLGALGMFFPSATLRHVRTLIS